MGTQNLSECMEENKWISQIRTHWKKGFYALLILACLGVWTERFYRRQQHTSSHDYLVMRQIFERFKQARPIAQESLQVAERIVKRHPQLHPSYDAMLAQCYLAKQDSKHAALYAQAILKRTSSFIHPNFSAFAQATSCIMQGEYDKAYDQAARLESILQTDTDFDQLRAFNLLRLVFLAQRMGRTEESAQWNQSLQQLPTYSSVASLFELGELSLQDYLLSN